jgi:hypothetical protein
MNPCAKRLRWRAKTSRLTASGACDREAGGLASVTLSYTMHRADLPEAAASLPQPPTRFAAATPDGAARDQ